MYRQNSVKIPKINNSGNPISDFRVITCRRTDRQVWQNKPHVHFLKLFAANVPDYEHQRGMYLISQHLSGNPIYFWTRVSNIIGRFYDKYLLDLIVECAGPFGRAVKGVILRPFTCWDCGFQSRRGHGCECCVATSRSLVLKSPIKCDVPDCDRRASQWRSRPTRGCRAINKKYRVFFYLNNKRVITSCKE